MGGHWGTSSDTSNGSTVRAPAVAAALEEWTDATGPSDRDAVVGRLSAAFSGATVRRGDGSTAYDVIVDDVPVLIAHRLDAAFRRDFRALADGADDLVVYSTTPHAASPNDWREFRYRHRGRHAEARIRFVHRRDASEAAGPSPLRALATIAAAMLAISGLLAGSLGLFGTADPALSALGSSTVATVTGLAIGVGVALLIARRRVSIALLKRIPHT